MVNPEELLTSFLGVLQLLARVRPAQDGFQESGTHDIVCCFLDALQQLLVPNVAESAFARDGGGVDAGEKARTVVFVSVETIRLTID